MSRKRLGLYLIGAYGSIGTHVVAGLIGMREGLFDTQGMVSTRPEFAGLGLSAIGDIVVGGCDIRRTDYMASATESAKRSGTIPLEFVRAHSKELGDAGRYIKEACAINCGERIESFYDVERAWVQEAHQVRIQAARHAGKECAERKRHRLLLCDIDAHRLCRDLILAHRDDGAPRARVDEVSHDEQHHHENAEHPSPC